MRKIKNQFGNLVKLHLSEKDTYKWANRKNNCWPGSTLSGHTIKAEFDCDGRLCAIDIDNGKNSLDNFDGYELGILFEDLR